MNRFVFALVLSLAASALAETAWVRRDPPHVEWFGKPSYVDVPDVGRVWNPPAETLLANGWESFEYGGVPGDAVLDYSAPVAVRDMTQAEIDARAAAAEAAAAEAEAQAALPTVFETGIAVLDADGHHMEFVPVADGEPPLAIQISDSPLDKATRDAKVAAKLAELAAAKAECKALKDRELDDLKAAIASAKNHKELGAAVVKWIEATEPATVEDSK